MYCTHLHVLATVFSYHCVGKFKISASTAQKYITINVTAKNDLAITCSIINFDQLGGFNLIQLQRENGTTFDIVISMLNNGTILWKDKDLKDRASANGTREKAELRLFIPRSRVQCFIDFTKYKCTMEGPRGVPDETDPKTASNIDICTCMYVLNTMNLILLKMYADLLNDILKKEMFVLFIQLYKL